MSLSKRQFFKIAGLPILAAIATFVALLFAGGIVSDLPRLMQGASVTTPMSVVCGIVITTVVLLP